MKKSIALGLLVVSLALAAGACGDKKSDSPASDAAGAKSTPFTGGQNPTGGAASCNRDPGCGGTNIIGSCTMADTICIDYAGGNNSIQAELRKECETSSRGRYSDNRCSTANLAGSCKQMGGTVAETVMRFYAVNGMNPGIVKTSCADHGNCAVFCAP